MNLTTPSIAYRIIIKDKLKEIFRRRPDLDKLAGKRRGLSPAKRIQERGKDIARLKEKVEDGSYARDLIKNIGVVSLSKNALNIPMWSHYADFHRGIVLEFRIPIVGTYIDVNRSVDRLFPLPVSYSIERPSINLGTKSTEDLAKKLLLTKSEDWRYEEEERVIDQVRGPGVYKYLRNEILCSVIAGLKIGEKYNDLKSLVERISRSEIPHLSLFRITAIKDEYKLTVEGHPRLDIKNRIQSIVHLIK